MKRLFKKLMSAIRNGGPPHTAESVAKDLADGLCDGSLVLTPGGNIGSSQQQGVYLAPQDGIAAATAGDDAAWSMERKPLKFKLWNSDQAEIVSVLIDPFSVAAVVLENRRTPQGGRQDVAVIHLVDGHEFVVMDTARTVADDVWLGKSFSV